MVGVGGGRRAAGGGRRRLLLLLVLGMCWLLRGVGVAGSAGGGAVGMGHAAAVVAWRHAWLRRMVAAHGCGAWLRRMVALHSRGGNIDKLTWLQTGFFLESRTLVFLSGTHIFLFFLQLQKRRIRKQSCIQLDQNCSIHSMRLPVFRRRELWDLHTLES